MQRDLFGAATLHTLSDTSEAKPDFLQRYRLNLRLDQTLILALLLVVAYVLVFSFGVESGKRYAMAEIKAERAMRERMARELGEKIFASQNSQTSETASLASVKSSAPAKDIAQAGAELSKALTQEPKKTGPGKYAIQTVTFTSKTSAEKYLAQLTAKGYQGTILTRGKFQQVCVTGFENREKAAIILGKLKSQGLAPKDAYIRPIPST